MVNKNELLSVVDEFDTLQKPVKRHIAKKSGLWFRAVHVWIVNHEGKILVQKRSLKKDQGPGLWEPVVAGHITHGDDYFSGAVREVYEETGLLIKKEDLNLHKIYKTTNFREYRAVFYCKLRAEVSDIKLEEDEVDQVKFLQINTLKKYLLKGDENKWIMPEYQKEMFSLLS